MGNHHYRGTKWAIDCCWIAIRTCVLDSVLQRFEPTQVLLHEVISLAVHQEHLRTHLVSNPEDWEHRKKWAACKKCIDSWIEQATSKAFKLLKQATIAFDQRCKQFQHFPHVHLLGRWYFPRFYASSGWNEQHQFLKGCTYYPHPMFEDHPHLSQKNLVASWNTHLSYHHDFSLKENSLCSKLFEQVVVFKNN